MRKGPWILLLAGTLYGLAFGSGTLLCPLIALGALAGGFSGRLMRRPSLHIWLQRLSGLLLFAFGLHLAVRQILANCLPALRLWGEDSQGETVRNLQSLGG